MRGSRRSARARTRRARSCGTRRRTCRRNNCRRVRGRARRTRGPALQSPTSRTARRGVGSCRAPSARRSRRRAPVGLPCRRRRTRESSRAAVLTVERSWFRRLRIGDDSRDRYDFLVDVIPCAECRRRVRQLPSGQAVGCVSTPANWWCPSWWPCPAPCRLNGCRADRVDSARIYYGCEPRRGPTALTVLGSE